MPPCPPAHLHISAERYHLPRRLALLAQPSLKQHKAAMQLALRCQPHDTALCCLHGTYVCRARAVGPAVAAGAHAASWLRGSGPRSQQCTPGTLPAPGQRRPCAPAGPVACSARSGGLVGMAVGSRSSQACASPALSTVRQKWHVAASLSVRPVALHGSTYNGCCRSGAAYAA